MPCNGSSLFISMCCLCSALKQARAHLEKASIEASQRPCLQQPRCWSGAFAKVRWCSGEGSCTARRQSKGRRTWRRDHVPPGEDGMHYGFGHQLFPMHLVFVHAQFCACSLLSTQSWSMAHRDRM